MSRLSFKNVISDVSIVPSLEVRLTVLRRRRRHKFLKQLAFLSPLILGMSFVLLATFGGIAGFR